MTNKSTNIDAAVSVENCCMYDAEKVNMYAVSNGNV